MPTLLKPEIRFEEKDHKYFLGDRELPSITKILSKLGLTKSYEGVSPYYAERGVAVHAAIALDLENNLDEDSLDPQIRPFLEAFRAFRGETGFKVEACEKIVYSENLGYAGRIDWLGTIGDKTWLIDGKCTKKHDPAADYQLCGQAFALEPLPDRMGILELHEDETFDLIEYPVENAMGVWLAVMGLWKRKEAIKEFKCSA